MSTTLTGKPQLNRLVNRHLILERIQSLGEVSRAELAKRTDIRPPTVSAVVKQLIDEGLVEEVGRGATSGGRAPRMVALSRNQPRALGFEISETHINAGLCDLSGNLCVTHCEKTKGLLTPDQAVNRLYELGCELLKQSGVDWSALFGVAVAVPGHLKGDEGHIRWSRPFEWRDVPFKAQCEERWQITTDVVNDSFAGAMAAHRFEIEDDVKNLVYLFLRFLDASHDVVGIGSSSILNGEPYHGEFGAAGEITTPVTHPLIHARNLGHDAIAHDISQFAQAVSTGDTGALAAMRCVGDELAPLVMHIANLLEPGLLMVGSDAPELRDALLPQLRQELQNRKLPYEAGETRLVASQLGEFAVVRGAIVQTLRRVFSMPQWS